MSHLRRDLDFVIKQYTHFCKKLVYKKPSSSLFKILIRFIIHFNKRSKLLVTLINIRNNSRTHVIRTPVIRKII